MRGELRSLVEDGVQLVHISHYLH
eukprot:SAG25_NODE_10116_length_345_cov_1.024390_1_plen_23_part_10